jgi:hypothetical protein
MTKGATGGLEVLKTCEHAKCEQVITIKKVGKKTFTLFSCRIRIFGILFLKLLKSAKLEKIVIHVDAYSGLRDSSGKFKRQR